jgi:hypothetical protein
MPTNKVTKTSPAEQTKTRGRKPDGTSMSGQVREMLATGMSASEIAKKVGCRLGLVYNVKARAAAGGQKKRAAKPAAKAAPVPAGIAGIDGIVAAVRASQREGEKMRAALEKIQALLTDALS